MATTQPEGVQLLWMILGACGLCAELLHRHTKQVLYEWTGHRKKEREKESSTWNTFQSTYTAGIVNSLVLCFLVVFPYFDDFFLRKSNCSWAGKLRLRIENWEDLRKIQKIERSATSDIYPIFLLIFSSNNLLQLLFMFMQVTPAMLLLMAGSVQSLLFLEFFCVLKVQVLVCTMVLFLTPHSPSEYRSCQLKCFGSTHHETLFFQILSSDCQWLK